MQDRLDDVRREKCEIDYLEGTTLRKAFRYSDLLERLTLLDRIEVLMRPGDVADRCVVDGPALTVPYDNLGLDAALTELERDRERQCIGLFTLFFTRFAKPDYPALH